MKRLFGLLALIIVFGFALPQNAFAADDEGVSSLEQGAPIRNLLLLRSGRFEIQPLVQAGINETFHQSLGFGGNFNYYFTNYLGIGATFVYNPFFFDNDEIKAIQSEDYDASIRNSLALARPRMNFDVGIYYAPVSGKFSLFGWILNYDFHLYAGFGAILMSSNCAVAGAACENVKNKNLDGAKFAGVIGLGTRLFFNNFIALNIEVKDYLSKYANFSRSVTDDRSRFQNHFVASLGISLFFPVSVYMSR